MGVFCFFFLFLFFLYLSSGLFNTFLPKQGQILTLVSSLELTQGWIWPYGFIRTGGHVSATQKLKIGKTYYVICSVILPVQDCSLEFFFQGHLKEISNEITSVPWDNIPQSKTSHCQRVFLIFTVLFLLFNNSPLLLVITSCFTLIKFSLFLVCKLV